MSATTFIYCLTEPGTRVIRYFGKADNPKRRFYQHLAGSKQDGHLYCARWITSLKKGGKRPDLYILCEVPQGDFERFERAFIFLGKQCGFPLTNLSEGGEGASGLKHSPETKAKLSAGKLGEKNPFFGKRHSPEIRAVIAAKSSGRKHSLATKAKMSAWQRGKKLSPEHAAKLNASRITRHSLESRNKMSASRRNRKHSCNTSGFVGISKHAKDGRWQARFNGGGNAIAVGRFDKIEDAVFARSLAIATDFSGSPRRKNRDNTSGFLGVCRDKGRRSWMVTFRHNKKTVNIGRFKKIEDAVFARNLTITNLL